MSFLQITVQDEFSSVLRSKLGAMRPQVETSLANQIAKDTTKYVPASGAPAGLYERVQVIEGKVIYPGPYARYLYYGKVMVNSATGKGPMRFIDKYGNELIVFPKGSKLRATDRDLTFSRAHHKDAQSHWFEASKAQNLEKWIQTVEKAVKRDLNT